MDDSVPFCQKLVWLDHKLTFLRANLRYFQSSFCPGILGFLVSTREMYPFFFLFATHSVFPPSYSSKGREERSSVAIGSCKNTTKSRLCAQGRTLCLLLFMVRVLSTFRETSLVTNYRNDPG